MGETYQPKRDKQVEVCQTDAIGESVDVSLCRCVRSGFGEEQ